MLQLTDLPQYPAYDPKLWARVAQWRSSWRYETDLIAHAEAEDFLYDVQLLVNWISPKVTGGQTMPATLFDYRQASASVREILQKTFGPSAAIRTDEGEDGKVFVRIVSDRFDGLNDRTKQGLIWDTLRQDLKEEAQAVALVLAFGTDQL